MKSTHRTRRRPTPGVPSGRRNRTRSLLAALLLGAATSPAWAGPAPDAGAETGIAAPQATSALGIAVQRERLSNGLRVVLNEDHSSPTVAVCVTYDVGSRNEVEGRSGFAHLFEHMMFQGSRNVGKGDHFVYISSRGGSLNGTTSSDRTNYFELAPSSALSLLLWLEADRMKTLAVTAENFENQRKVVQEEYRMRVSNAAYAQGHTHMNELVFQGYFPYAHDPIGSMQDLDAAQLSWIREFHAAYYAPNNAVLAISGDFQQETVMELVRKYFADARPSRVPPYAPPPAPEQTTARRAEEVDANAKTDGLYVGWMIPQSRVPEHYALELASLILAYGDSSTLHQKLVVGALRSRASSDETLRCAATTSGDSSSSSLAFRFSSSASIVSLLSGSSSKASTWSNSVSALASSGSSG
jgi:predicted Zn-dependent peptidase